MDNNYITQYIVGCNYSSMSYIPAFGTEFLICQYVTMYINMIIHPMVYHEGNNNIQYIYIYDGVNNSLSNSFEHL